MAWPIDPRPAKSLTVLLDQVNARWPTRAKGNDGMLASAQHTAQNPTSDHEARNGVVHALDITKDLPRGVDSRAIAQALLNSRDPRIKYIISNGEMARAYAKTGTVPWQWSKYTGPDDHSHHMHLSVVDDPALADSRLPWNIDAAPPATEPKPTAPPQTMLPRSGKGSWYSQYDGKFKWVDTGDAPNSAALGCPDDAQGVSFMNSPTLGKWFHVLAPNGVMSLEQQTDIGPNPNTGRLIDISAAAAERFGYSPQNFPTDSVFSWEPADPPLEVRGLPPKEQATRYRDIRRAVVQPVPPKPAPAPAPTPAPVPTRPPTMEPPDMDLFKFLPLLMRLLQILPKIQEAVRSGTSIITLLQEFAPDLIGLIGGVGGSLFPNLIQDNQVKVGALMMDPVKVRGIQNAINKLGIATLETDGLYGQKTKDAVIAFQKAHNVTPADGWAGDVTWAAMQTEVNKLTPQTQTAPSQNPVVSFALPTP